MLATFLTSLILATSVPTQQTEVAPKQVAIIFKDQQAVYNITKVKNSRKA